MASQAWKASERRIAAITGGKRVISEKGVRSGTEDVAHPTFSIESKHGKTVLSAFIRKAYEQAAKNAPDGKVPLVVLHPSRSKRYYAVLDLEHLVNLLGDQHDPELIPSFCVPDTDASPD